MAVSNVLTHSRMACARACLRKHLFRYEWGMRPTSDKKALRMGGWFARGQDQLARGVEMEAIAANILASYYGNIPDWCTEPEELHEWQTEAHKICAMLRGWLDRWRDDLLPPIVLEDGRIGSEVAFEVSIINPETGAPTPVFRFGGKFDRLTSIREGRLALVEQKTSGIDISPGSDYWRKLRIDPQISGYVYAGRMINLPIDTVIYDVTRKPEIQPRKIPLLDADGLKIVLDRDGQRALLKNGKPRQSGDASQGWELQTRLETPEEYGARLVEDMRERPDFYFCRQEIARTDADLEEWQHDVWQQQQQLRECQRSGRWFRSPGACLAPWKCEYFDLCTGGYDLSSGQLPEGFEIVENVHPELQEVA